MRAAAAIEEIVVTAQKREQALQEVPLSVEVVAGDKLDVLSSAGEDVLFLAARVPSVYAESSSGRTFPRFYIRGLGNTDFDLNSSQPVSLVYDEIVLENPILKGFPVFDLDRIEVLRGPQGTLFGRNTPAGVIKFESARPTAEFEGYARASYGRFDAVDSEAAISGPLAGKRLLGRLSLLYQRRDDFVENTFALDGEDAFEEFDEFAGRLQTRFAATDRLSLLLNIHGRYLNGGSRTFRANIIERGTGELIEDFDRRFTAQDADQILKVHNFGTSLTAAYDAGPVAITSVTGYEIVGITARGDVDGGFGAAFAPPFGPGLIPFPAETADNITDHIQLTEELRVAADALGRLSLQAGVFLFYEDLEIENLSFDTLAGGTENGFARQEQETRAWALFASAGYELTDRLSLNAGLRFSDEEKEFVVERLVSPIGAGPLGPIARAPEDSVWSGDAGLVYALAGGVDLYARIARSFRAPAIQGRLLFGDVVTVADTETIWSYEAGVKSVL